MRLNKAGILLLIVGIYLSGCAPYYMKAKMAQRDKRYDLALDYALRHLRKNPGDDSALRLAGNIARKFYQAKQAEISRNEQLENWENMVAISQETHQKLKDLSEIPGMNFPSKAEIDFLLAKMEYSNVKRTEAVYLKAKRYFKHGDFTPALEHFEQVQQQLSNYKDTESLLAETKQQLANATYQTALNLFQKQQFSEALAQFRKTHDFVPHYQESDQYIVKSQNELARQPYEKGRQLLLAKDYRGAIEKFNQSHQYVENYQDVVFQLKRATTELTRQLENQAEQQETDGDRRAALTTYREILKYQPDNVEIQTKSQALNQKLTMRLAVLPFQTQKLGTQFSDLATNQILSALSKKSESLLLVDREHLKEVLEEQALSQTGIIDESKAVEVGKLVGVSHIMAGKVTLVSSKHSRAIPTKKTAYYKKNYLDPRGIKRSKKVAFNYMEYESRRTVVVAISYRLIDVETGKIIDQQNITRTESDAAKWVTCDKNRVNDLPSSARQRIKATKIPKSANSLINQAFAPQTKNVANKIFSKAQALKR